MTEQVKLAYQESEVVALLKKIPLGLVEMSAIRERAEQLRDGNLCDYRPVLPLMLASFIFDVLCTPGWHPNDYFWPSDVLKAKEEVFFFIFYF